MADLKNVQETVSDFVKKLREESSESLGKAEAELKKFVGYLVEKKKVTKADGQKIYKELQGKIKKGRKDFDKKLEESTRKVFSYLNLPRKSEVDLLSSRVDDLSRKVKTLKTRVSKG